MRIFQYYSLEYRFDVFSDGVWGVDGFDHVPDFVIVFGFILAGEDEVVADFDAEVDGFVGGMGVPERFQGGNPRVYVGVPVGVCGAEEVLSVFDEDIPDCYGVFDGSVFLVE